MNILIIILGLFLGLLTLVPLSIKWELDKKITIPAACIIGILSGLIVWGINSLWDIHIYQIVILETILIAIISISLILWRFFRDPKRIPPDDKNAILSPADGEIIYIKKIEKGQIPLSEKKGTKFLLNDFIQSDVLPQGGYLIGILLTYLDVHINRAPVSGKISLLKHIDGLFLSLKKKEAVFQNERALIVIDNEHFKLGIVQIASRLVRKIVPYIREGQEIQKGAKIGMIRFGSQVDIVLPNLQSIHITVKPKDKVKAGLSIIATVEKMNMNS